MYKILNTRGLGVNGKQNELIELALTYKFDGVEVDMVDLVGRHDAMGKQFACQFLQSAKIDMGTFALPVELGAVDEVYNASLAKLDTILDLAKTLDCKTCYVEIAPNNEDYSFQECFENHQQRLQSLAEKFAAHDVRIGLALKSSAAAPADGTFKFIQTAEELMTLVKAVGSPTVGVCLDSWEWVLGGGTVDQLNTAGFDKVTEIRMADVAEGADKASIKMSDRTALPADQANSFSYQLMTALLASEAAVPVAVSSDLSTYAGGARDNIVKAISNQLDVLIGGQDPAVVAAEAAAAESAEGEEAAAEGDAPAPASVKPAAAPSA